MLDFKYKSRKVLENKKGYLLCEYVFISYKNWSYFIQLFFDILNCEDKGSNKIVFHTEYRGDVIDI